MAGSNEFPFETRWSLKSPGRGWSLADTAWLWDTAEELGFDAVFHNDHVYGSTLEAWTTLAAMFARTERIRGGTMVTSNSFRPPTILAKMAATVDIISGGRLIVGLGTGNEAAEYSTYGLDFPTRAERVARLDAACQVLRAAWSGRATSLPDGPYPLQDAVFAPVPVQRPGPRLVIGVKGDRALALAVRHADEWNWNRAGADTSAFFERMDRVDELCEQAGRDPASLDRSLGFRRLWARISAGDEQLADVVTAMRRAIDRGAGHVVLMLGEPEQAQAEVAFYREVLIPEVMAAR